MFNFASHNHHTMQKEDHISKDPLNSGNNLSTTFLIVIGRQFGSGGRTIGKIIANQLHIGYYDTELLKMAAKCEGLSQDVFRNHDEKKPSVLKALLQGAYGIADNFHTVPFTGINTYNMQCKVIKDICKNESCVIVGRNADYIMRNHPRLFSVFLHAPLEHRIARIMERQEAPNRVKAIELAQQNDKRREGYYNFYRGEKKWGIADNYDMTLDTSNFENETVANLIISVVKKKFKI